MIVISSKQQEEQQDIIQDLMGDLVMLQSEYMCGSTTSVNALCQVLQIMINLMVCIYLYNRDCGK